MDEQHTTLELTMRELWRSADVPTRFAMIQAMLDFTKMAVRCDLFKTYPPEQQWQQQVFIAQLGAITAMETWGALKEEIDEVGEYALTLMATPDN